MQRLLVIVILFSVYNPIILIKGMNILIIGFIFLFVLYYFFLVRLNKPKMIFMDVVIVMHGIMIQM